MAIDYFTKFPKIAYDSFVDGSVHLMTDITRNVAPKIFQADDAASYTYYNINDGDKPDHVSNLIYGTPAYYWTFFVLNDTLRSGINSGWPLSSQEFENMMEKEFDAYSALTFFPIPLNHQFTDADLGGGPSSFSMVSLDQQYLPYLRLIDANDASSYASIVKYDHHTLQLIIKDVVGASRQSFKSKKSFKLVWTSDNATVESEILKSQWIKNVVSSFADCDPVNVEYLRNLSSDRKNIEETQFAFGKLFIPNNALCWEYYRNAAAQYYIADPIDASQSLSTTAFDVVNAANNINPKYISYYEKEVIENQRLTQIKIVRADKIQEFADAYFNLINDK